MLEFPSIYRFSESKLFMVLPCFCWLSQQSSKHSWLENGPWNVLFSGESWMISSQLLCWYSRNSAGDRHFKSQKKVGPLLPVKKSYQKNQVSPSSFQPSSFASNLSHNFSRQIAQVKMEVILVSLRHPFGKHLAKQCDEVFPGKPAMDQRGVSAEAKAIGTAMARVPALHFVCLWYIFLDLRE